MKREKKHTDKKAVERLHFLMQQYRTYTIYHAAENQKVSRLCELLPCTEKVTVYLHLVGTGYLGRGWQLWIAQLLCPLVCHQDCCGSALLGDLTTLLLRHLSAEGEQGLGEDQRHHAQVTGVPILHDLP